MKTTLALSAGGFSIHQELPDVPAFKGPLDWSLCLQELFTYNNSVGNGNAEMDIYLMLPDR